MLIKLLLPVFNPSTKELLEWKEVSSYYKLFAGKGPAGPIILEGSDFLFLKVFLSSSLNFVVYSILINNTWIIYNKALEDKLCNT